MAGSNFPNGSLVLRIWRFDGGSEMLGKFQYFDDAVMFSRSLLARDIERDAAHVNWFYLAVCDHDNKVQAVGVQPSSSGGET